MTQAGMVEHAEAHETHSGHGGHGPIVVEQHFDAQDLEQMDADDVQAGRAIGKLLVLFFIYTVIATSGVGIWTYLSLAD
ncbi:MAG: hypothetical protein ACKVT0_19085 [Planctomycetaceae bacterium]